MKAVVKFASILAVIGINSLVAQGYNANYSQNSSNPTLKPATAQYDQMTDSDVDLARKIRTALKSDGSLSDNAKYIRLSVQNGLVTLSGSLTPQERAKVESIVRKIEGIRSINNNINNNPQ